MDGDETSLWRLQLDQTQDYISTITELVVRSQTTLRTLSQSAWIENFWNFKSIFKAYDYIGLHQA